MGQNDSNIGVLMSPDHVPKPLATKFPNIMFHG